MAKIDTSTIQGYSEMTAEQKLAALEGLELPEPDLTGYVKKDVLDKATHDAAEWKRKHNELLSEDERRAQERAEQDAARDAELEQLRREKTVSGYTSQFIAQGYSADLAADTASALADGDMAKVFANQGTFLAERDKAQKVQNMKNTPHPSSVGAGTEGAGGYAKQKQAALDAHDMASYCRLCAEEVAAAE